MSHHLCVSVTFYHNVLLISIAYDFSLSSCSKWAAHLQFYITKLIITYCILAIYSNALWIWTFLHYVIISKALLLEIVLKLNFYLPTVVDSYLSMEPFLLLSHLCFSSTCSPILWNSQIYLVLISLLFRFIVTVLMYAMFMTFTKHEANLLYLLILHL